MKVIRSYPLTITGNNLICVATGAKVLSADLNEQGKPVVFVLEDDAVDGQENKIVQVMEQGMHIKRVLNRYLGTYIFKNVRFHVFIE